MPSQINFVTLDLPLTWQGQKGIITSVYVYKIILTLDAVKILYRLGWPIINENGIIIDIFDPIVKREYFSSESNYTDLVIKQAEPNLTRGQDILTLAYSLLGSALNLGGKLVLADSLAEKKEVSQFSF